MRHILLHHHLFKNAGSTLDLSLKKYFGETFSEFHADQKSDGRIYPNQLYKHLEQHPHLKALSSHHFFGCDFNRDIEKRLLFENRKAYSFHDCVFIRHPVMRLVSMYVYFRTIPKTEDPLHTAASQSSLAEFLNILVGHHPNFVINAQVTIFGANDYGAPPSSQNLERAIARLKKATVLGTVEEYAKTIVLAEYFLQPLFGGLELHYPRHENASDHALLPGYNGSLESIKDILGASYFSDLCDLNDLDIELWHATSKELRRRAFYVKDFAARFKNFSKRCSLATAALEETTKTEEKKSSQSQQSTSLKPKTPRTKKVKLTHS
ncbi:MAG: sulfotransferase family 2 domain-containing protein [Chthoniobacterales bacterium]|nr:sulfotransferase family 2 domain-containing protein [Chthoniobacterales bacterium]